MKHTPIITRNQAAELWGPLDQRLQVDGDLGSVVGIDEALAVSQGANEVEIDRMVPFILRYEEVSPNFDGRMKLVLESGDPAPVELLRISQARQQVDIKRIREEAAEILPGFLKLLGEAVGNLVDEGILTDDQSDRIQSRFFDDHGNPTLADTPVSMLEYYRMNPHKAGLGFTPYVKPESGIIVSARNGAYYDDLAAKHKVHEAGHAWLAGMTLMIGGNTSRTSVDVGAQGLWTYETVDNNKKSYGFKANEGAIDLSVSYLMSQKPTLQELSFDDTKEEDQRVYMQYRDTLGTSRSHDPAIFRAVMDEYIAEPTPEEPDIKLEATQRRRDLMRRAKTLPEGLVELFQ